MSPVDSPDHQCAFLKLPLDLRNRVYELIFFARRIKEPRGLNQTMSEFEARKLNWASTGLVDITGNQIHPYRRDSKHQPQYDLSIFRVNHQIQEEAERVFYGWSSFNLTGDVYAPGELPTFQFFETLPRRYRQLIRRVEIRCFYRSARHSQDGNFRLMRLFDWNAFMKFLALECPSLRGLVLWGFADGGEGEDLERCCHMKSEWVQSILQIKTLRSFDIRAIPRRKITEGQSCVSNVLQDLRSLLYRQSNASMTLPAEDPIRTLGSAFPLMRLPSQVRKRLALLPANRQLHPYLKSWYDVTTRQVVPLFLTCRQIQREAEAVLYGEGIFCAPAAKYDQPLSTFLRSLPPRLSLQTRHTVPYSQLVSPFIDHALANKHLTTSRYVQKSDGNHRLQQYMFVAEHLYKPWPLKRITIEAHDTTNLCPLMRDWIAQGFMDLGLFNESQWILMLDW